ncbi:acetyl-CoA C-acyltransferase [Corynebacterium sp. SCR221107]|uniref:acetyl-CoA C-acyltransferase n=1 Tax=Corynebacterium sp. SCR221107 TaxID=3017361 RepID=UPI0022EC3517|nr:acetyl-CoA C-acyltransferase [Corynebacterium sp. SCR221107]WBT08955.1 acetyl-CoA C-acyltransferase [Corynebacterium sp. SCR221107]
MTDIFIASAARLPIGRFGGSLAKLPPRKLGTLAATEAIARAGVEAESIGTAVTGSVVSTVPEDKYIARTIALDSGLPFSSTALTVNRLCGSGLQALVSAAQVLRDGDSDLALVSGVENMSQAPYSVQNARFGQRMGDGVMYDWLTGALTCPMHKVHMGVTAETVAQRYGISRERQDEFSALSQARAIEAIEQGRFDEQIVPVTLSSRGKEIIFDRDEHPRATSAQELAGLRPVFSKDGTVTAGNSSGLNDSAGAIVLATEATVNARDLKPLARVVSWGIAGVDPAVMGLGPIEAVPLALKKAGLKLEDIDLIESNEAFAAQALAVQDVLGFDPDKTNVDGGAIALGHPIGATGVIIATKLVHRLRANGGRYGLATMCIGGGQGIAVIVEAC